MKITSINVWTVVVPTIPGRVHSPEYVPATGWDQVPKQIVRVETDTEYYGIGEAGRGPAIEEAIAGARLLLRRDPEAITLQNIYAAPADGSERKLQVGTGPLYEAYEMAVFDLVGRIRLLPVHALLGGAVRERSLVSELRIKLDPRHVFARKLSALSSSRLGVHRSEVG